MRHSINIGKTKLPAAVPETQIPFANARRLLKYNETIIIPGVVDKPPPIPINQQTEIQRENVELKKKTTTTNVF